MVGLGRPGLIFNISFHEIVFWFCPRLGILLYWDSSGCSGIFYSDGLKDLSFWFRFHFISLFVDIFSRVLYIYIYIWCLRVWSLFSNSNTFIFSSFNISFLNSLSFYFPIWNKTSTLPLPLPLPSFFRFYSPKLSSVKTVSYQHLLLADVLVLDT